MWGHDITKSVQALTIAMGHMVYAWPSQGLLSQDFGVYVYTRMALGPFGNIGANSEA